MTSHKNERIWLMSFKGKSYIYDPQSHNKSPAWSKTNLQKEKLYKKYVPLM